MDGRFTGRLMDPLDRLQATIRERQGADPASSYTASLFARGRGRIAQKLGEEAVETVIAALHDPAKITSEAADLIFHLLVLLADAGLSLDDVRAELATREGVSGHAEKAARNPAAPVASSAAGQSAAPLSLAGVAADATAEPGALPLPLGRPIAKGG